MGTSTFAWDTDKATSNLKKHRVGFPEGTTIFYDEFVATLPDPEHSDEEDRFLAIGTSFKGRVLVVVFTERNEKIRIVSCRKATTNERKFYEENSF